MEKNGKIHQPRRADLFRDKRGHHRRWIPYLIMYRYSLNLTHRMRQQYLRTAFCNPGAFAKNLKLSGKIAKVQMQIGRPNSQYFEITEVSCDS